MDRIKTVILGSSGFVGKSLTRHLATIPVLDLQTTSRQWQPDTIYFDLLDPASWDNIARIRPSVIIDASGYGVVKGQSDLDRMYKVNYLDKRELIDHLDTSHPELFWVQIGTAFEYQLENEALQEDSPTLPKTHYGISKLLFSEYLQKARKSRFLILRPFGMFGEGEDTTKLFPMLIEAQKKKQRIDLSDGEQQRDYFYVNDLATFIARLFTEGRLNELDGKTINVGTGVPQSIRQLSDRISAHIPDFEPALWNWGAIPQRKGENRIFYNSSQKAEQFGFETTPLETAFYNTVQYYYNL